MQQVLLSVPINDREQFRGKSSFIPITWGYRTLIVGYVLIYNVLMPGLGEMLHGSAAPLAGWRFVADVMYQLLLYLPILFYRSTYGWLHPLIFISVYKLATSLIQRPETLLAPFLAFGESLSREVTHVALVGLSSEAITMVLLKSQLISLTALIVYYFGFFFGPRLRIPHVIFPTPRNVASKALTVTAFSAVVCLIYILSRGGLTTYVSSFGQGRREVLDGFGPIVVLIQCGMIASLIWFALDRTAHRRPMFWVASVFSVPVNFIVSGSRSAVIYSVVLFLLVLALRYRKIPQGRSLAMGIIAFVLFGALGTLRNSSSLTGDVDWTVLTDFDLTKSYDAAREESAHRASISGHLHVMSKVPDEVDFLYGETYLGALFFFVPRALWPDKPHSVGDKVKEVIVGGGGGLPVGGAVEAYWNFYIPGVVFLYFLYGVFHQWLAQAFLQYSHAPAAWVLYALTLFGLSPAGLDITSYLQKMIPAIAILYRMGALSLNSRKTQS